MKAFKSRFSTDNVHYVANVLGNAQPIMRVVGGSLPDGYYMAVSLMDSRPPIKDGDLYFFGDDWANVCNEKFECRIPWFV